MINNSSSKCKNCMVLIRIITLLTLTNNVSLTVKHVRGKLNTYADNLSRMEYKKFRMEARKHKRNFSKKPESIPVMLWPMDKVYN